MQGHDTHIRTSVTRSTEIERIHRLAQTQRDMAGQEAQAFQENVRVGMQKVRSPGRTEKKTVRKDGKEKGRKGQGGKGQFLDITL
ncbi:MAG: hypothetical protein AB1497_05165 [Bacillota bacterium]